MSTNQEGPSLGDVVKGAAFVVGLITAWLYVAGWTYAYYYLDRFRIPLLMTELPREHFFVYGGLTIWKNLIVAIVTALVVAILTAFAVRYRQRIGRSGLVGILVAVVLVVFVLARQAGVQTAHDDYATQRQTDYRAFPRVIVEPEQSGKAGKTTKVLDIAASGCARLVLFNKERLFLIRPRRDAPALEIHTLVVPWEKVASLTISDSYGSCP